MKGTVLTAVLLLSACGSGNTPSALSSVSPSPAASAAGLLFAVVESPSTQAPPDTLVIVGLDGHAKAKAQFLPRQWPYMGNAAVPMQGVAQVVGAGVYYIDGNGTVRMLRDSSQPVAVASFPQQPSQYETWFAVSPDGSHILAGVLQYPAIGAVPSDCTGMCLPPLVGPWKFSLQTAPAGGKTTEMRQYSSATHPDFTTGWKPIFPVGWTSAGAVAMVPVSLGTQNAWWGGPLYVVDSSGNLGRQVGGADCNSASIAPGGFIACTSGQYVVMVRDSFGDTFWTTQVEGFNALSLYLSPDGQAISDGTKVERRTGGLVTMPQGFQVEGWLDNNAVIGRMPVGNAGERGNLSWITVSDPGNIHDLGFKGDFVGTIRSAS